MPLRRTVGLVLLLLASLLEGCGGAGAGSGAGPAPAPQALLTLAEILPPAAEVGGGMSVHVRGTAFLGAVPPVLVRFGGRVAVATVQSDMLLEVAVPPGDSVGVVDTAVLTGSGIAQKPGGFTYLAPPPLPPRMAYVPSAALPGTRITLSVSDFPALQAPSVTFGGFPAPNLVRLSATEVRVDMPSGPAPGTAVDVVLTEGADSVTAPGFFAQGALNPGDLAFNEFLANPGTLDSNSDGTLSASGDEFVELVNRLGVAVDLTGWTLHDATNVRHTFPNPTTVPAGGSIVVFGSGNPTFFPPRHVSGHAQVAATGDLGLNNTADSIVLRTPAGTTIAQVNYATADVAAGRSRNAPLDGQAKLVPAASVDYVLHDTLPGAVGPISPGTKANGTGF